LAEALPPTPHGLRPLNIRIKKQRGTTGRVVRSDLGPGQIRELLAKANVSQCGAARQIGISERSMRRYIAGEMRMPEPAVTALQSLCLQST
jgi:hypothetical protein